ncbi:hypothetical protein [Natronomonas pharaonis]|nr:hypothetical protein [Natronomonas pharaonis]
MNGNRLTGTLRYTADYHLGPANDWTDVFAGAFIILAGSPGVDTPW